MVGARALWTCTVSAGIGRIHPGHDLRAAWIGTVIALDRLPSEHRPALSWRCLLLSPNAVGALVLYSYGKRFTDFPQVLLGIAQFMAPVGAWLAVTNEVSWTSVALGLAVGTSIGGFDLIYSCQDAEVDRRISSRSFPARFGVPAALQASSFVRRDARRLCWFESPLRSNGGRSSACCPPRACSSTSIAWCRPMTSAASTAHSSRPTA